MKKKAFAASLVVLMAFSFASFLPGFNLFDNEETVEPGVSAGGDESVLFKNAVTVQQFRDTDGDGERELIHSDTTHNLVVDQGLDFFTFAAAGVNAPNNEVAETDDAIYIALSEQGDVTASDTSLENEITTGGLSRSQGTTMTRGVGNYSVWHTFTATQDFNAINMTGLHWNNTAGSPALVAEASIANTTLLTDDQVTVNWTQIGIENQ